MSDPTGNESQQETEARIEAMQVVVDLRVENARLREAIKWALGERGNFALRKPGRRVFWWRTELRQRAFVAPTPDTEERNLEA